MGGIGSGCWRTKPRKLTVDESLTLDIGFLQRTGHLTPGHSVVVRWPLNDEYEASIGCFAKDEELVLSYIFYLDGYERHIETRIPILITAAHFGGYRYWALCPFDASYRWVTKLYLPPCATSFACRRCHDLTYASSQESNPYGWQPSPELRWPGLHFEYFKGIKAKEPKIVESVVQD